jgi:hypothetical protein
MIRRSEITHRYVKKTIRVIELLKDVDLIFSFENLKRKTIEFFFITIFLLLRITHVSVLTCWITC